MGKPKSTPQKSPTYNITQSCAPRAECAQPLNPQHIQSLIADIRDSIESAIEAADDEKTTLNLMSEYTDLVPVSVRFLITLGLIAGGIVLINPYLIGTGVMLGGTFYLLNKDHQVSQFKKTWLHNMARIGEYIESQCRFLAVQTEALTSQVTQLKALNHQLKRNISTLTKEIKQLKATVGRLTLTASELNETKDALASTHSRLQTSEKQLRLSTAQLKTSAQEIERLKAVQLVLRGTVDELSSVVVADEKSRIEFQQKLRAFLDNKEKTFDAIATRISAAEEELRCIKEAFHRKNQEYEQLLKIHKDLIQDQKELVERLEALEPSSPDLATKPKQVVSYVKAPLGGQSLFEQKPPTSFKESGRTNTAFSTLH